jgi:hypothetical protein
MKFIPVTEPPEPFVPLFLRCARKSDPEKDIFTIGSRYGTESTGIGWYVGVGQVRPYCFHIVPANDVDFIVTGWRYLFAVTDEIESEES